MYLIYINELGPDYKNQKQYEFIFSDQTDMLPDEWTLIPSSGRSVPPDVEDIKMVGTLKNSDMNLELVQNSDYFGVIDAVDGIIPLGWEPFDQESDDRPERLFFRFGEDFKSIEEKLNSKELKLIIENINVLY